MRDGDDVKSLLVSVLTVAGPMFIQPINKFSNISGGRQAGSDNGLTEEILTWYIPYTTLASLSSLSQEKKFIKTSKRSFSIINVF